MKHIAAIILAAGSAKRFGANKLLESLTLGEATMPMLAHSIEPWLQVFEQVNIVVNAKSKPLINAVYKALPVLAHQVRWLICEDAHVGMGVSLSYGITLNAESDGWLVGLGDMPLIPSSVITDVKQALVNGADIAAPYLNQQRGHPVGFSAKYRDALMLLRQDGGAKEILTRDHMLIRPIVTEDSGIFVDIDTREDLAKKILNPL
jgi:molybdenum cofactor cytidylyltransferase